VEAMKEVPREPPAHVKRQLRQEAGFGCCICGYPFYEYHHIREYSTEPHHDPKDMMVLCPNHHHQATVHAIEEADQRSSKLAPFNIKRGFADGQLFVNNRTTAIEIGSNLFIGDGFKLAVDNEALVKLESDEEGRLLISIDLHDRYDLLLVSIVRNEWKTGDPLPWDFEFGFRWLRIRRKQRDIALYIDARNQPTNLSGDFWRKGQHFSVSQNSLVFNGVIQDIGFVHMGFAGLMLLADTAKSKFHVVPEPSLGKGKIFNWPDEATRVEWGVSQYYKLLEEIRSG
jgi:hypothetical protein